MGIKRLRIEQFTAFKNLDLFFSPGINILIGENGIGKTHLLKVLYAGCDITISEDNFIDKLIRDFLPTGKKVGRLVQRQRGIASTVIEIFSDKTRLYVSFTSHTDNSKSNDINIHGLPDWKAQILACAYIPSSEVLINAPNYRDLYDSSDMSFEEIEVDLIGYALIPALRGPTEHRKKESIDIIEELSGGKVMSKHEEFFLRSSHGNLEFSLLGEGLRKLALLGHLIRNGTLHDGSVLFWDVPEADLNPKTIKLLARILLHLQQMGVQVFMATHSYLLLKELELQREEEDDLMYHVLYRYEDEIKVRSAPSCFQLPINPIADAYMDVYDREIKKLLMDKEKKESNQ